MTEEQHLKRDVEQRAQGTNGVDKIDGNARERSILEDFLDEKGGAEGDDRLELMPGKLGQRVQSEDLGEKQAEQDGRRELGKREDTLVDGVAMQDVLRREETGEREGEPARDEGGYLDACEDDRHVDSGERRGLLVGVIVR